MAIKNIVRGGNKGATEEADCTSTDVSADRQALDVAVIASVAIPISGTVTVAEPVSIDDNGGSITVDDGGVPLDVSVVGSVTIDEPVSVDDNGGSLTVDATSWPLPTGAATEATLALIKAKTDNLDVALSTRAVTGLTDAELRASPVPVSDGGGSLTIDAVALPLPTGAATEATLATRVADATITARLNTLGQKPMATSAPVVIASDQSAVPISGTVSVTEPVSVDDNGGSLTVDTPQLPAALVGGRLDVVVGASLPAGAANIGDVDVLTVPAPLSTTGGGTEATALRVTVASDSTGLLSVDDNGGSLTVDAPVGTPVNVQIGDGTLTATVRDTGSNDSLNVAIVDAAGNQVTAFGAGTQYTEDDASSANPIGTQIVARRRDTLATETSTDGDVTAANATAKGELYVKHVDSVAITDGGGSVTIDDGGVALEVFGTVSVTEPVSVDDNGGSLTVDTPQLPAALVGGRLDENVGAWLGSTAPTVGQKTMAASVPVVLASDQTAISFTAQQAATSAVTNVAQSAASVTLLAANANRVEAVVYNDGTKDLFVKFGAVASLTSFTFKVPKDGHVVIDSYIGIVDGIWSGAGAGAARVTEMTP